MTLAGLATSAARLLLRHAIRRHLRCALPEVFRELDAALPLALMNKVPPLTIELMILRAVQKRTGMTATPDEVSAIAGLFDPRRAARPLNIRDR